MRKSKVALFCLCLCLGLCCFLLASPKAATAATPSPKVLLVYDSKNVAADGQKKLDGLQRLLTSFHYKVTTVRLADYQRQMLTSKKYQGVVTLINWPEAQLSNSAFDTDRQNFTGIKLHIGANLSDSELQALQSEPLQVYHQQFTISGNQQKQLLPFSASITLLKNCPDTATHVGQLTTQESTPRTYDYGTVVDNNGYIPYFSTSGLSMILAADVVAKLTHQEKSLQPVLAITGVTPYSDLTALNRLTLALYRKGIPFMISTTSVADNNDLPAFRRFAKALRNAENRDGLIFLQTPTATRGDATSGTKLGQQMQNTLVNLGQLDVFPVGISTPGYWNQDYVYRNHALQYASHVLLLPNPETLNYAQQDNQATTFDSAIYGMPINSLTSTQSTADIHFPMLTAVTVSMPNTTAGVDGAVRKIEALKINWFEPTARSIQAKIQAGAITYEYNQGNYYLNGTEVEITENPKQWQMPRSPLTVTGQLNNFFKVQSNVLLVIFSIIFVVLIIFIFVGRRIYRRMFVKK
ncbi:hypothetical protein ACFQ5M_05260 [Agrilactobacillus yilanensis]|uniref:DUF2334 domain-containing protein n=1 Tax=Agrilactobacillus yilanensis TaxID=2485997 RepID=A0ABW4J766_9LACO|nr:hypothetical protein [Agrilactobacillus yilanensis]